MLSFLFQSIQCSCCAVLDPLSLFGLPSERLTSNNSFGAPSLANSFNSSSSSFLNPVFPAQTEAPSFPKLAETLRASPANLTSEAVNQLRGCYISLYQLQSAETLKAFFELLLYGVCFENYTKSDLPKILKDSSLSPYLKEIESLDLSGLKGDLPLELFTFDFMKHKKTIGTLTQDGLADYETTQWYISKKTKTQIK